MKMFGREDLRANVCKCVYMRDGMLQDFYPRMLISMHRKMISRVRRLA